MQFIYITRIIVRTKKKTTEHTENTEDKKREFMKGLLYSEETYKIKGAVFNVYKEIGCGFLENVYEKALAVEFAIQEIPFKEQQPLSVIYKGVDLGLLYKPDFICFDKIIIELKAVSTLA